jgi:hypothetical protein
MVAQHVREKLDLLKGIHMESRRQFAFSHKRPR